MQSQVYQVMKSLMYDYCCTVGITLTGNGAYRTPDGNYYDVTKDLPKPLNIIARYYDGVHHAKSEVNDIKNLYHYPFKYTEDNRHENVFWKLNITTDDNRFAYRDNVLTDNHDQRATDVLHSAVKHLRTYMANRHSNWKIRNSYPRIKYLRHLHEHGMITSDRPMSKYEAKTESAVVSAYLIKHLHYNDITVSISPLEDRSDPNHSQVVLASDTEAPESYYQAIQQWLIYIMRTSKLACPELSVKGAYHDLAEWHRLTPDEQREYVIGAITSLDGRTMHRNYTYSFKAELHQIQSYEATVAFLAWYRMELANYDWQPQLLSERAIDPNPEAAYYLPSAFNGNHQHHHYTYHERYTRAIARQDKAQTAHVLKAGKMLHRAMLASSYIINHEINKKATENISDGRQYILQEVTDRMRSSGIPP